MVCFYVAYDRAGQCVVALVAAPKRPASLRFSSRDDFRAAMDLLDCEWQLRSEAPMPPGYPFEINVAWLERMASAMATHNDPPPPDSIFSFGGMPSS
jgi:hypothetical protein